MYYECYLGGYAVFNILLLQIMLKRIPKIKSKIIYTSLTCASNSWNNHSERNYFKQIKIKILKLFLRIVFLVVELLLSDLHRTINYAFLTVASIKILSNLWLHNTTKGIISFSIKHSVNRTNYFT